MIMDVNEDDQSSDVRKGDEIMITDERYNDYDLPSAYNKAIMENVSESETSTLTRWDNEEKKRKEVKKKKKEITKE